MRIFAKKSFGFRPPQAEGKASTQLVRTIPGQFQDVPDWVRNDDLFKTALKEGSIEVVYKSASVAAPGGKKDKGKEGGEDVSGPKGTGIEADSEKPKE